MDKKRKISEEEVKSTEEQAKRRRPSIAPFYIATAEHSFTPISAHNIMSRVTSTITSSMQPTAQASTSKQAHEYIPMSSAHYLTQMDSIVEEVSSTVTTQRQRRALESSVTLTSIGTQAGSQMLEEQHTDVPTCVMCNETKNCRVKCHVKGRCIHTSSCLHGWQLDRLYDMSNDRSYALAVANSLRDTNSNYPTETITTQTQSDDWVGMSTYLGLRPERAAPNRRLQPATMFIETGEHSRAQAQQQEQLETLDFALDMSRARDDQ